MLEEFRGLKIKGLRRLRLPRAFWRLSRPPRRPPPHAPPPMDGQLETTPTPKPPQAPPLQKFLSKTLIKTCGFLHSRTMSSCSFTRHTRGQDVPGAARDPPQIVGLNGIFRTASAPSNYVRIEILWKKFSDPREDASNCFRLNRTLKNPHNFKEPQNLLMFCKPSANFSNLTL